MFHQNTKNYKPFCIRFAMLISGLKTIPLSATIIINNELPDHKYYQTMKLIVWIPSYEGMTNKCRIHKTESSII